MASIHEILLATYDLVIYIDTETRSECDLLKCGGWKYAEDRTTEIMMASMIVYSAGQRESPTRANYLSPCIDTMIMAAVAYEEQHHNPHVANIALVAHNMDGFEYPIFMQEEVFELLQSYHPDLRVDCFDSATFCRMNGVPASLNHAAQYLLCETKLETGTRLINTYSKPRKDGAFNILEHNAADLAEMIDYCDRDTALVKRICEVMYLPSYITLELYLRQADSIRTLNDRGVSVAVDDIEDITAAVAEAKAFIDRAICDKTAGSVAKASSLPSLKRWVSFKTPLYDAGQTLDVARRADIMADKTCPEIVRRVLTLVDAGNSASVKKYTAFANYMCEDEIIRGCYVDHGAGQTTRLSSRGVQLHNMNRDTLDSESLNTLVTDPQRWGARMILENAAKAVRQMIIPRRPDAAFIMADWSNIEARVTPWLANTTEALSKLEAYADPERDPYLETADALGFPGERQAGKVTELAMGFLGGAGALLSMADNYGLNIETSQANRMVTKWRKDNAWALAFGDSLVSAAKAAVRTPDIPVTAGYSRVFYHYSSIENVLTAHVGNYGGRVAVRYRNPRRYQGDVIFDSPALFSAKTGRTIPKTLWRGLAVENVTQAYAALLLRTVIGRQVFYDYGVMTTHDDVVLEVPIIDIDRLSEELRCAMVADLASFAPGLTLDIDLKVRSRLQN